MLDFVIRNVKLPGKAGSFDLGINDGLFVEIVESLKEKTLLKIILCNVRSISRCRNGYSKA